MVAADYGRGRPELRLLPSTADLFHLLGQQRCATAVLDIPIGLPESGPRECDKDARLLLGRRASTVFSAPPREVVEARSQSEATLRWRRLDGRGCSAQTFGILPRIREVDLALDHWAGGEVFEGHPEIAFLEMAGQRPLPSKHTGEGRRLRMELLSLYFPSLPEEVAAHPSLVEDALDAFACLWTAGRIADGRGRHVPSDSEETDSKGIRMAIWY